MICILKTTKRHNSVNNVGRVPILCTLSDNDLFLYEVL